MHGRNQLRPNLPSRGRHLPCSTRAQRTATQSGRVCWKRSGGGEGDELAGTACWFVRSRSRTDDENNSIMIRNVFFRGRKSQRLRRWRIDQESVVVRAAVSVAVVAATTIEQRRRMITSNDDERERWRQSRWTRVTTTTAAAAAPLPLLPIRQRRTGSRTTRTHRAWWYTTVEERDSGSGGTEYQQQQCSRAYYHRSRHSAHRDPFSADHNQHRPAPLATCPSHTDPPYTVHCADQKRLLLLLLPRRRSRVLYRSTVPTTTRKRNICRRRLSAPKNRTRGPGRRRPCFQ